MFQKLSFRIANSMAKESIVSPRSVRVYAYGLELLLSLAVGILVLIAVSILEDKPLLWLPYLAGFVPVRLTGGGYHAKTHLHCISIFAATYLSTFFISPIITKPTLSFVLVSFSNLLIFLLFSPVEALNKPLKTTQQRKNRRRSLYLGIANLAISVGVAFLHLGKITWLYMYFAGSGMAGLSMLISVLINFFRKET